MKKICCLLLGCLFLRSLTVSAAAPDFLRDGFITPPDSAKPQTWWHWMNGNITKQGITADLEAMKQIGLGGATIVNVDCDIPRGTVDFMGAEWRDDFKFAVSEANRLGLKLCVENCAGWSSSGGPWNTPANAMQRLTCSETSVQGPIAFDDILKQPPTTLKTYHDIAVLAFRSSDTDEKTTVNPATSAPTFELQQAVYESMDGKASKDVKAKILELIQSGKKSVVASNSKLGGDAAEGQKKRLRIVFTLGDKPQILTVDENDTLIFPLTPALLAKARRTEKSSIDRTFVKPPEGDGISTGEIIPSDGIVDLTTQLLTDGRLKWNAPPGNWIVLRLGYTPIGVENHPAPREGTGLECDKLSKAALDAHWDGFMQKVLDDVGPLAGKSLEASLIDSYEVGGQDWTPKFREEFQKRRGYDPVKFLPTYARHIVESPAVTERFLWDMRRTVADLFADNYYAHFTELCHQHGLNSAVEPYTGPFESLQCGSTADVVMGEFWTGSSGHPSIKMCASIAHIYGKTIVGAESFTAGGHESRWQNDPYSLKTLGDLMFCQGLNRYIFHRYAMQPWMDRKPGMTMGEYGLNFERTQTWWDQGKPWIDYISRCEFLLQQGRTVTDVAYFTGESAPVEMRVGNPAMPAGYDYDAINADVLLHGATVENGRIKIASGQTYAVLMLPPDDVNMTPGMLECISNLVHAGATVIGPRPQHSPSLTDYPICDARVNELADELWGKCDGKTITENTAGKGRVLWGQPIINVFNAQKLKPDFESKTETGESNIAYTHRTTADSDIFFVSNQQQQFKTIDCTFRVNGKTPEIFHPDTGLIEPAPIWNEQEGRITVQLNLDPAGSVFVIFRSGVGGDHVITVSSSLATQSQAAAAKLEIQHAVYAGTDGNGKLDVTAKLTQQIHNGHIDVEVTNDALGPDPAVMHEKQLTVDYTIDGSAKHVLVHEHKHFTVPTLSELGEPAKWEATMTTDGKPAVRAWNNGQIELHTSNGTILRASCDSLPPPQTLIGGWTLNFPPHWGAPPTVTMDKLISWTDHSDAGVRYFSGTATYEKAFNVTADQLDGDRELWLDLGRVKNFADVIVNGQHLGLLWKPPFRLNITAAVKNGENQLVVKVTNLWPNRIIGDEQLPPDSEWDGAKLKSWPQWLLDGKPSPTGRLTFATWHHWSKTDALLESGLLGPVTLQMAELIPAK